MKQVNNLRPPEFKTLSFGSLFTDSVLFNDVKVWR